MSEGEGGFLFGCGSRENALGEPSVKGVSRGAQDMVPAHLLVRGQCEMSLTVDHRAKFLRLIVVVGGMRCVSNALEQHGRVGFGARVAQCESTEVLEGLDAAEGARAVGGFLHGFPPR